MIIIMTLNKQILYMYKASCYQNKVQKKKLVKENSENKYNTNCFWSVPVHHKLSLILIYTCDVNINLWQPFTSCLQFFFSSYSHRIQINIYFSMTVHGVTTNKIVTSSARELFFLILFAPLLQDWTACFFTSQNRTKQKQKCKNNKKNKFKKITHSCNH